MHRVIWMVSGAALGFSGGWLAERTQLPPRIVELTHSATSSATQPNDRWEPTLDGTRAKLRRLLSEDVSKPDGNERSHIPFLFQVIDALADADPIGTARLIIDSGLGEDREQRYLFAVADRWFAEVGPAVLETPSLASADLRAFRNAVFVTVANERPLDALPRAIELDDDTRTRVFDNLIFGASPDEIGSVIDALLALPATDRVKILEQVGTELSTKAPERTLQLLEALSEEERNAVGHTTLAIAVGNDPKRGLQLINDGVFPNDPSLVDSVLFTLAQSD